MRLEALPSFVLVEEGVAAAVVLEQFSVHSKTERKEQRFPLCPVPTHAKPAPVPTSHTGEVNLLKVRNLH